LRGRVLVLTTDQEEAWQTYRKYVHETGLYARVDILPPEKGSSKNVLRVVAYDEPCRLNEYCDATHMDLRLLAKTYMRVSKLRVATSRLVKFVESDTVRAALEEATREKAALKRVFKEVVQRHPIYRWCQNVSAGRGGTLGAVDALMFLGWIDPHECNTGGRAKAFWGLTPEGKLTANRKAKGRPELKGVAYMITKRVIMGKDSYYYPLYQAKREWFETKYPEKIVVERGGKTHVFENGKPGYRAVINGKAMFWLMQLLVSNAQQVIRETEGLEVPKHHPHIEPKPAPNAVPDEDILDAVRNGEAEKR